MNVRALLMGLCVTQLMACAQEPEQPILKRLCGLDVNIGHAGASSAVNIAIVQPDERIVRQTLKRQEDGHYHGRFDTGSGQVMYWLEIDGRRTLDPTNPLTMLYQGREVSVSFIDACQAGRFVYVGRDGTSRAPKLTLMLERRSTFGEPR